MAKTLIILVLLFDGTLIQERYDLAREMSVYECLAFGDDHKRGYRRISNRHLMIIIKNGWYLKDGRGTVQGHMCE